MRILFLDCDGVLNSYSWVIPSADNEDDLDPRAMALLNEIIEKSDAKVVIHSTWRKSHTVDELRTIFERNGFKGQILGTTPVMYEVSGQQVARGVHIQAWLDLHERFGITSFAILDDIDSMEHLKPRLVQTSMAHGIQQEHVEKVLKLLLEGAP